MPYLVILVHKRCSKNRTSLVCYKAAGVAIITVLYLSPCKDQQL